MKKIQENILKTFLVTSAWCFIWVLLETLIYGQPENRLVDNIMTIIVIPIIYMAVKRNENITR